MKGGGESKHGFCEVGFFEVFGCFFLTIGEEHTCGFVIAYGTCVCYPINKMKAVLWRMRVLTQLKLIMTLQGPKQSHQSQVYRHNNKIILQRN